MRVGKIVGLAVGINALVASSTVLADDRVDGRLEEKVEKRFNDDKQLKHLDVDVADGTVTLRGEVASRAERARAERLARDAGAGRVVNRLEIDADKAARRIDAAADAKKERIEAQAERQKEAVERRAEATKERLERRDDGVVERRDDVGSRRPAESGERRRDDRVADPLVTAKVKSRIVNDDHLDRSDIDVDTDRDGVVTLKGSVPSEAARARAVEIARTTEGVRRVIDTLKIRAPVERR